MTEGWRPDRLRPCFTIIQLIDIMCLAVPGLITGISDADPLFRMGMVDFGGISREVNLGCIPEAEVGDYVIVHVGMALSVMDRESALQARDDLRKMVEESDTGRGEGASES